MADWFRISTALHCLVIEDEPAWQIDLRRALESIGGTVNVEVAANSRAAHKALKRGEDFDLATIDLSLLGPRQDGNVDESGLRLVEEFFRESPGTALLVVTGHSTGNSTRMLLRDRLYRVFDVVEKKSFRKGAFVRLAREALRYSRLHEADDHAGGQYRLTVTLGHESWLGSELRRGSEVVSVYHAERPVRFAAEDLARRGDRINLLLAGGPTAWREEADSVGEAIAKALREDNRIADDFAHAKALCGESHLRIEFSSPADRLGIPFELMWDDSDRLCFRHLVTRRLERPPSHKTEPFRRFIERLSLSQQPLRVLYVGACGEGETKLEKVKEEIDTLAAETSIEALRLGLKPEIVSLCGQEVSEETVGKALRQGGFHIFHYAGHGSFANALPEWSGLNLGENQILKATDLRLLLKGTPLQLVFLSSCLSARTAQQVGRGDFQGIFDALAQADIPVALGYRWTVDDRSAMELAQSFWQSLWKTLSPAQALYEARQSISMGDRGRDDETWASPVLLCQTD